MSSVLDHWRLRSCATSGRRRAYGCADQQGCDEKKRPDRRAGRTNLRLGFGLHRRSPLLLNAYLIRHRGTAMLLPG
jgi:hypothetical protein